MAVLKANVLIRDGSGEIVRLPKGMSSDALEALADEYSEQAQTILDNPAHWVDALPDAESGRRNLLGDESNSLVKPRGTAARRRGGSDDDEDAPKRRGRKPAPKGVVEA